MAFEFVIDSARRLIYTRVSDSPAREDWNAAMVDLRARPGFDPSYDVVLDMRDADLSNLSSSDIQALASRTAFAASARRALVAETEGKFGIARMYEARRELAGGEETIRICKTLDEALKWLGQEGWTKP